MGVLKKRPPIPLDCPPFLRRLLQKCWHYDPECRSAFTAVHKQLLVSTILEAIAAVFIQVFRCELLTSNYLLFPSCASRVLLCVQEELLAVENVSEHVIKREFRAEIYGRDAGTRHLSYSDVQQMQCKSLRLKAITVELR